MKYGFGQLKKLFSLMSPRTHIRLERKQGIALGAYGIMLIFAALMLWSGFLFYTSVLYHRPDVVSSNPPKRGIVSSRQLKEVIKLLDERERAFQEILNEGISATTTPAQ